MLTPRIPVQTVEEDERMNALLITCTLKASPERPDTAALAGVVVDALREEGVEVASVRVADHAVSPGAEILVYATPAWLGRPSSAVARALERQPVPAPPCG